MGVRAAGSNPVFSTYPKISINPAKIAATNVAAAASTGQGIPNAAAAPIEELSGRNAKKENIHTAANINGTEICLIVKIIIIAAFK